MWAGLLIGILFGLFTTGHAWLAIVAAGIGLGVLWGASTALVRTVPDTHTAQALEHDLLAAEVPAPSAGVLGEIRHQSSH